MSEKVKYVEFSDDRSDFLESKIARLKRSASIESGVGTLVGALGAVAVGFSIKTGIDTNALGAGISAGFSSFILFDSYLWFKSARTDLNESNVHLQTLGDYRNAIELQNQGQSAPTAVPPTV